MFFFGELFIEPFFGTLFENFLHLFQKLFRSCEFSFAIFVNNTFCSNLCLFFKSSLKFGGTAGNQETYMSIVAKVEHVKFRIKSGYTSLACIRFPVWEYMVLKHIQKHTETKMPKKHRSEQICENTIYEHNCKNTCQNQSVQKQCNKPAQKQNAITQNAESSKQKHTCKQFKKMQNELGTPTGKSKDMSR